MSCPRYRFTFVYEYISGGWSFYCIYANDLEDAKKQFEKIPSELYFIKYIDRVDNYHHIGEKGFEPETRLYSVYQGEKK